MDNSTYSEIEKELWTVYIEYIRTLKNYVELEYIKALIALRERIQK